MNANKTIHEARGLCWHEFRMELSEMICAHCGVQSTHYGVVAVCLNPNYTDPVHYYALMDWMREGERALKFDRWIFSTEGRWVIMLEWIELTTPKQVALIAEAIEAGVLK